MQIPRASGSEPSLQESRGSRSPRPLAELARALSGVQEPESGSEVLIRGVAVNSRQVQPGDLFVAVRGTQVDGHAFIKDAVERGAAAAVVEREVEDAGIPLLWVENSRRALADLAAEWYGRPAERLPLVGITGTLGKTSVLSLLEAILTGAGRRVGVIGSLGVGLGGKQLLTGHTTPDPLLLQQALARMIEEGAELAAMEVTSHALVQDRVHGLRFRLGIFTNLVPLEHMEYHGSFEDYAQAKLRYFDYLQPGAPLVYAAGDRAVSAAVEERDVVGIGCGAAEDAEVQVERRSMDAAGTHLLLKVRQTLPRLGGGQVEPVAFPLELRLLGRSNVNNVSLAATAALCLGAPIEAVQSALAVFPSPPRRLEVIHRGRFTVLDDTVGHPDSISAVFEVAELLEPRRLHVVFAIRGQRGPEINRGDADAITIWAERVRLASLIVTRSAETADERNRVEPEERDAFVERLREGDLPFEEHDRLEDAITLALERAGEDDLILLLGAQGMDAGAEVVRGWGEERGETEA